MQDIISPERRSIRNISIDRPQQVGGNASPSTDESATPPETPFTPFSPRRSRENRKWMRVGIWSGIGLVVAIILFVIVGSFFEGATVRVTPRHSLVNLDDTVVAGKAEGNVGYEVVEVPREESKEVPATGEERIERASSGTIVIYNDFDTNTQKLIKNTRFESSDGKIYRIRDSVTVPGQHKGADGKMVPGSVEAEVFADSPGEDYNIGLSDFTIPGFKEAKDPRYDKFYARSKTPIAGGFVGTVKTASADVTATAKTELKTKLEQGGAASLEGVLPEGFILLPDTVTVVFEDLPNADGTKDDTVLIRMKSATRGVAINGNDLAAYVASHRIPEYDNDTIEFEDASALSITLPKPITVAEIPETFELKLSGPANLIWTFDAENLKQDLSGIHRDLTDSVLSRYGAIEKADISIKPFWRRSMPSDPETIEIVTVSNE